MTLSGRTAGAVSSMGGRARRYTATLLPALLGVAVAGLAACSSPDDAAAHDVPQTSERSAVPRSTAQSSTQSMVESTTDASLPAATEPEALDADISVPPHPIPRGARLVFTGDVLSHGPVTRRAFEYGNSDLRYDYRPMFAQVRKSLTAADLAICHLESPLSGDNTDLSGYPLFNVPGDLAVALADAGYDGCSTASNHSLDRGVRGIKATLDTMDRAGLGHAGMARTDAEANEPVLYRANGIVVGHLSYTYGLNKLRLPPDHLWAVDVIDVEAILTKASAAVRAGAEFVVLSIQWGHEYTSVPTAAQRRLAAELLEEPSIDLIVGSHAHVPQPVGRVGDKHVIFGVGNFLTNQSPLSCRSCPAATADGVIVEVVLTETPARRIEVVSLGAIPTWVDRSTFTIVDVAGELAGDLGPNRRGVLERSWRRTARVLRADGADIVIKGESETIQHIFGAPDLPSAWPLARR